MHMIKLRRRQLRVLQVDPLCLYEHTDTPTRTRTHTLTHTCTHTHIRTHINTTHKYMHTYTPTHLQTRTHMPMQMHTHTNTYKHTFTHTPHTNTHNIYFFCIRCIYIREKYSESSRSATDLLMTLRGSPGAHSDPDSNDDSCSTGWRLRTIGIQIIQHTLHYES